MPPTRLTVLVKYLSTTSRLMPTALEDLGGLVGLDGGDAHFGGDLHDAVEDGAVVVVDGRSGILIQHALSVTSSSTHSWAR